MLIPDFKYKKGIKNFHRQRPLQIPHTFFSYNCNKKSPDVKTPIFVIIIDSPRFYFANHCYYWLYKDERILDIDKLQSPDYEQYQNSTV